MKTLIKICGLSTEEGVDAAVAAGASHVGFVFFARSPRNVSPERAGALGARVGGKAKRVGLFVDAHDALIERAIAASGLEALQFHGNESPARVQQAKARFALPVWKALPVETAADIARAEAYQDSADSILFDAKTPKGALPGGMGVSFDWSLLTGYGGGVPWGVAGGLTPDNVGEALGITHTPLVDVSSGVESAPGVKDVAKIAAFCEAVRNSDRRSS